MERAIIYCAKTGLEATDHFVPELLEKYCKDNGYEIVANKSGLYEDYREQLITAEELCQYQREYEVS